MSKIVVVGANHAGTYSVQLSVDVGAFVAGRLLGGVEAGDDVDHTAGGGHVPPSGGRA